MGPSYRCGNIVKEPWPNASLSRAVLIGIESYSRVLWTQMKRTPRRCRLIKGPGAGHSVCACVTGNLDQCAGISRAKFIGIFLPHRESGVLMADTV